MSGLNFHSFQMKLSRSITTFALPRRRAFALLLLPITGGSTCFEAVQKKTDMEIEEADLGDEASDHKTEDDGVNKKQRRSREKPAADAKDTASYASTVCVCDCFLCV